MKNIIWVGNRLSDIEDCYDIFNGSINLYGTNTLKDVCFTTYRANNNNISNPEIDRFIEDNLNKFLAENPNNRFMFYTPKKTYALNKKIQNNTLCLNDYFFLEVLNDNRSCHNLFNDIVKFAPHVSLLGQDIKYANLKLLFPQSNQYVRNPICNRGVCLYQHSIRDIKNFSFHTYTLSSRAYQISLGYFSP